jgi:transcriptional regulator with XRE-family HTH domain
MRLKKSKQKDTADYSDISKRFRDIRINHRLTQVEMGELVGLASGSVGAIEQGLYTPNFSVIRILKQKLNINYDYLIDGDTISNKELDKEIEQLREENARLKRIVDKLTK